MPTSGDLRFGHTSPLVQRLLRYFSCIGPELPEENRLMDIVRNSIAIESSTATLTSL